MGKRIAIVAMLVAGAAMTSPSRAEDARVQASFLGAGTYATEDDCKALREIEAGKGDTDRSPPRLITADGAKLADDACRYLSVRARGASYIVRMSCSGGCDSTEETVAFVRQRRGGFAISIPGSKRTLPLVRCEPAASTTALTN